LDLLFERNVSARKFASTNVDVFEEEVKPEVVEQYEEQILEKPHGDAKKVSTPVVYS